MKALAIALICTLLALGLVAGVEAQTTGQPGSGTATPAPKPESPATPQADSPSRVRVPGAPADRPDVNVDVRPGPEDPAALPRQSTRETPGIFGLSATTAALFAAALFIIVVLAVVAMTRGRSDTRVDLDRRL
ncbi:MAG: hypothetical protein ACREJV_00570 [Candidatus Rokuibacteriota bacterium]